MSELYHEAPEVFGMYDDAGRPVASFEEEADGSAHVIFREPHGMHQFLFGREYYRQRRGDPLFPELPPRPAYARGLRSGHG